MGKTTNARVGGTTNARVGETTNARVGKTTNARVGFTAGEWGRQQFEHLYRDVVPPQRNLLFTVLASTGNSKNGKRSSRPSVSEYRRETASMVFLREFLFEIFKI